jgi:hypothetical protein
VRQLVQDHVIHFRPVNSSAAPSGRSRRLTEATAMGKRFRFETSNRTRPVDAAGQNPVVEIDAPSG